MLNFKSCGCKISQDSLKARMGIAKKKSQHEAKIFQKKIDRIVKKK